MCGPAIIPMVMAVGSIGLGLIGGIQSANAQKAEGAYQAKIAENNAIGAEQQARDASLRGSIDEEKQRLRTKQMIGSQRAVLAANGVDLGSGTAVDLVGESAGFGEMDALTVRANAAREAWGFTEQAKNYRTQGRMTKWQANNAAKGTLLTTAANALGQGASLFGKKGG